MGILAPEKSQTSPVAVRRKSGGLDFGNLKPLNASAGTKNFGGYRDPSAQSPKSKKKVGDAMDSDADDEDDVKPSAEDADEDKDESRKGMLSPEDAIRQGELAEGVRKIKVRRPVDLRFYTANIFVAKTPTLCRATEPALRIPSCSRYIWQPRLWCSSLKSRILGRVFNSESFTSPRT